MLSPSGSVSANPPLHHGGNRMRIGLYARVSTMHNQNPEVQLAELREHTTRRGWEVVSEYIDRGITGARERRPELDRLWVDCRKRKVDAVLVYRYDGATRGTVLLRTLRHAFSLTTMGVAIGVGASLGLTRLLSSLLYNVKPLDAVVMIGTIILLFLCSSLAALLPARRA